MATDFRVVTPDDMGATLKLGAKTAGKYDVDVSQLELPVGITGVDLQGTVLTIQTTDTDKTVDLAPMLPQIAADTFLKNVERQNNEIVFTVGVQSDTSRDNTFTVDVADLLPVKTDDASIVGDGTTGNTLRVQVSQRTPTNGNNLLKRADNGLYVSETEVVALVRANAAPIQARDVRLVNASGQTVLGYIHSTEQ